MQQITQDYINGLKAALERIAPGPWVSHVEGRDHTSGSSFIETGGNGGRGEDIELTGASSDDQDFIARARQDVPMLLAEVERLRDLLRSVQTAAE